MSQDIENQINSLFSESESLYSLLWWDTPESQIINAHSFIIDGIDMVPIFSTKQEAKSQAAGSGYEKDIMGVKPSVLAGIVQGKEHTILNPGGKNPTVFKSCIVKKYIEAVE